MVYYFTSDIVDPPITLFMGRDKHENEVRHQAWKIPECPWQKRPGQMYQIKVLTLTKKTSHTTRSVIKTRVMCLYNSKNTSFKQYDLFLISSGLTYFVGLKDPEKSLRLIYFTRNYKKNMNFKHKNNSYMPLNLYSLKFMLYDFFLSVRVKYFDWRDFFFIFGSQF